MGVQEYTQALLRGAIWRVATFAIVIGCFGAQVPRAEAHDMRTRPIEADAIYLLLKFIRFPESSFANGESPLRVCIVGNRRLTDTMATTTRGRNVQGRSIVVIGVPIHQGLARCHVAVFGKHENRVSEETFRGLHRKQVLTVSIGEENRLKSLISVGFHKKKTQLRVRLEAAKRAGLWISSELLILAEIVEE